MITYIKNAIKKFKKYSEDKKIQHEAMQHRYPADYIYIGTYEEIIKNDGRRIRHTHSDAFLIDNKFKPTQAIRLTGEDTTYKPVTLFPSIINTSKHYDSYDVGDCGIAYHICISPANQPWYASSNYLSLDEIIKEIKKKNETDLAIEKEQFSKQKI